MKIYYNPRLKKLARHLRNNSTRSEVILWKQLRSRQLMGYQFMRQKPIGEFIVDFYCSKLKLAIEIDGQSHGYEKQHEKDKVRDEFLKGLGISVIRFASKQVVHQTRSVVDYLADWIERNREQPP